MKTNLILTALLLLSFGCSRQDTAPGAAGTINQIDKVTALETRIKEVESELKAVKVELIQAKADNLKAASASIPASTNVQGLSFQDIDKMIASAIEQRIGTADQIEAIFEETVQDKMTAYEVRKQQEKELEKERRAEEYKAKAEEREERRKKEREVQEKNRFETYAATLNIDQQQYTKVREIEDNTRKTIWETMGKMRKDGGYTPQNYTEAFTHIREEQSEALKEVLDETQYQTYKKQYMDPMSNMFRGFGGHRGR